jgi:putative hydrolase of the HAD superfamily
MTGAPDLRDRFAGVDTWVFDLDNTLYPAGSTIWPAIDARITLYLATLLGLDGLSARALQKHYYRRYGTTLKGLMEEHAIRADDFLAFVHDIDRTGLAANPDLGAALAALPGRKLILTNGSREHALRTVEQLGVHTAFEDVFDIVAAELVPKPEIATYDKFLARHAVDPRRAAMFEDLTRNLIVPHARGMRTILVVPQGHDHREAWEAEGGDDPHVDYVTDDLAGFLRLLALGLAEKAAT